MWKNLTLMTINRKGPELFCLIVPMIDSFKEIVNILPHVRKCLQNIPPVHVLHEHNNKSTRLQLRTCKGRYNHGRYNPDWMDRVNASVCGVIIYIQVKEVQKLRCLNEPHSNILSSLLLWCNIEMTCVRYTIWNPSYALSLVLNNRHLHRLGAWLLYKDTLS